MPNPLTEAELIERHKSQQEAAKEFGRLKESWPAARSYMSAEALALAFFLMGDEMFDDLCADTEQKQS